RSFMRGNVVGLELHWWLAQDAEADLARVLAPYANSGDQIISDNLRERLRLSGLRVVAVPQSELFVVHQIAAPRADWRRRWLGQETEWSELLRARRVQQGVRSMVYGSEQRLPGGVLRLVGRGWMQPASVMRDGASVIDAVMHIELGVQVEQPRPEDARSNRFLIPTADFNTRLADLGPFVEELGLKLSLPRGYALVLTADDPEMDWSSVEVITRENLIDEIQRRERGRLQDGPRAEASETAPRFGPAAGPGSASEPVDVATGGESDVLSIFETLDAPMPSLADSYGPPAARVPSLGQLLLESQDNLGRPMRAVVILIPRLPERYSILP
ncbi:MAG: hypothetical protein ACNA8P_00565, partial [Phycisphaerales bacterium]